MRIKTILCDIDGVLIWHHPHDPSLDWRKHLEDSNTLRLWEKFQRSPAWKKCLRDKSLNTRDFFESFLKKEGSDLISTAAIDIWLEHNLTPCEPALRQIQKLQRKGYECALASNQDGIRKPYIEQWLDKYGLGQNPRFISCDLNTAKPDEAYFSYIQKALNRRPEELLLIDDSKENIDVAHEAGWAVFFVDESYRLNPSKWDDDSFLPLRKEP